MLDIHWTLTAQVPQLDTLQQTLLVIGEKIVAELQGIQNAINALTAQQAAGQQDLATHLQAIKDEIAQLDAETITQEQLDHLAAQVDAATAVSAKAAEDLRGMTTQVQGMVPDTPPA